MNIKKYSISDFVAVMMDFEYLMANYMQMKGVKLLLDKTKANSRDTTKAIMNSTICDATPDMEEEEKETKQMFEIEKEYSYSDELKIVCPICLDKKADNVLPCLHSFCQQCIEDWYVKSECCPLCRVVR